MSDKGGIIGTASLCGPADDASCTLQCHVDSQLLDCDRSLKCIAISIYVIVDEIKSWTYLYIFHHWFPASYYCRSANGWCGSMKKPNNDAIRPGGDPKTSPSFPSTLQDVDTPVAIFKNNLGPSSTCEPLMHLFSLKSTYGSLLNRSPTGSNIRRAGPFRENGWFLLQLWTRSYLHHSRNPVSEPFAPFDLLQ